MYRRSDQSIYDRRMDRTVCKRTRLGNDTFVSYCTFAFISDFDTEWEMTPAGPMYLNYKY